MVVYISDISIENSNAPNKLLKSGFENGWKFILYDIILLTLLVSIPDFPTISKRIL